MNSYFNRGQVVDVRLDDMNIPVWRRLSERLEVNGPWLIPYKRKDSTIWPCRKLLDEAQLFEFIVSHSNTTRLYAEIALTPMPRDAPVTKYEDIA